VALTLPICSAGMRMTGAFNVGISNVVMVRVFVSRRSAVGVVGAMEPCVAAAGDRQGMRMAGEISFSEGEALRSTGRSSGAAIHATEGGREARYRARGVIAVDGALKGVGDIEGRGPVAHPEGGANRRKQQRVGRAADGSPVADQPARRGGSACIGSDHTSRGAVVQRTLREGDRAGDAREGGLQRALDQAKVVVSLREAVRGGRVRGDEVINVGSGL
jgi:hypothetical protein